MHITLALLMEKMMHITLALIMEKIMHITLALIMEKKHHSHHGLRGKSKMASITQKRATSCVNTLVILHWHGPNRSIEGVRKHVGIELR